MAADDNILKSFLYQIGAKLDEPSIRKAGDTLDKLSKTILGIGGAIEGMALSLAAATVKMADSFENMYYASRRTGASIKAMKVFDFTVSQLGGSADAAQQSIEGLADQLQRNPMIANWIKGQLHVDRRDQMGRLKDTATYTQEIYKSISGMFNSGNTIRALQYLDQLHLDKNVMFAVGNPDFDRISKERSDQIAAFGTNLEETGKKSAQFMQQIRTLGSALSDLKDSVFARLEEKFGTRIEDFTNYILAHRKEIADWVASVVTKIIQLEQETEHLITAMGGFKRVSEEILALWIGGKALGAIANITKLVGKLTGTATTGAVVDTATTSVATPVAIAAGAALLTAGSLAYVLSKFGGRPGASDHPGKKWQSTGHGGYWVDDPTWTPTPDMVQVGRSRASAGSSVPRGLRNNNPGNIKYGAFARSLGATGADDKGFAIFPSLSVGVGAASSLLHNYAAGGLNTVSGIIGKWAPASENNTKAYIDYVSQKLGVGANTALTPAQVERLKTSIFSMEVGAEAWNKAALGVDGGATHTTTINNDIDVNVTGSGDPQAAGQAAVSAFRPYATGLRNTKGGVN